MKRRNFLTATAGGLSWLVTQALAEADMISEHPEFDTLLVSTTLDDGFAISYWRRKK